MARQSHQLRSKDELRSQKPKQKGPNRKRALNAFTIAEREFPSKPGLARHRYGEDEEEDEDRHGRDHPSKRRKTEDDEEEGGDRYSDGEGNEFTIGEVDSENDSDIDSDEAMGSGDEEAFTGFSFRGSKGRQGKKDESDEEDGEGEDSDDSLGSDAVDLATAWDMNAEESEEEREKEKAKKQKQSSGFDFGEEEEAQEESGTEGDDESEEASSDDDEDEEEDEDALSVDDKDAINSRGLNKLQKFVNNLPTEGTTSKPTKHSNAHAQGGAPSEFGLAPSRKLTAADLIPTITDTRMKGALKHLDSEISTKKTGIPGKLDVPLAKRQQDRIERSAAFEKSKETLDRWLDTVKANRRAEHLQFPLPEQGQVQSARIEDAKPRTDLESAIHNILAQSGLAETENKTAEDKIQEFEELEAKKIPLEEIQARRAELRKARALMFREEARAKRIKKIKSKSYRRVHRKERERAAAKEREALEAAGVEPDEEERERADRERALARMGAKHRESKFAKGLKASGRAGWDDEARQSVLDAARRQEELSSRIEGRSVRTEGEDYLSTSSGEEEESESEESEGDAFDEDAQTRKLNKKLAKLDEAYDDADEQQDQEDQPAGPYANLLGMKFMRNADAARKAANDAEVKALRRELNQANGADSDEAESDEEAGRQQFGRTEDPKKAAAAAAKEKAAKSQRREFEAPESDEEREVRDEDEVEIKVDGPAKGAGAAKPAQSKKAAKAAQKAPQAQPAQQSEDEDGEEENPWLAEPGAEKRRNRKAVDTSADISLITNENAQSGSKEKKTAAQAKAVDVKPQAKPQPKQQSQKQVDDDDETSSSGSDNDSDNDSSASDSDSDSGVPVLLKNQDLVKRAFAGDEVFADFTTEKRDLIADEDEQVLDTTLPGWGSWVGTGLSKRDKQAAKKRQSTKTVEGIRPQERKDAKLDRVIINEKRQRKNVKYMASQLPHPFESRQQYERTLRLPVGPEWTTKETFQKATKPRVLLKQGVIKPLQKPLV